MPLTRADGIAAFDHMITNVMDVGVDSPIPKALKRHQYGDIRKVAIITQAELDQLDYLDANGTPTRLLGGHAGMIRAFSCYCRYRHAVGRSIKDQDWVLITQDEFDEFRTGPDYYPMLTTGVVPSASVPNSSTSSGSTSASTRDPVVDFKKGIKRDASLFTVLKDPKQWDTWSRSTEAQA